MTALPPTPQAQSKDKAKSDLPKIKAGTYTFEYLGLRMVDGKTWDTRDLADDQAKMVKKYVFDFRLLRPDQDVSKGHGRTFGMWANVPSVLAPPLEGNKPSTLYKLICALLNSSEKMTVAQLAEASEKLTALETEKAQFQGLISPAGKLEMILGRVEDGDRLPAYVRPVDPRSENDDPFVTCSVTNEQIEGWATREGDWIDNATWAAKQIEKLGNRKFRFDGVEGEFSPPFNSKYYRLAKAQLTAAQ